MFLREQRLLSLLLLILATFFSSSTSQGQTKVNLSQINNISVLDGVVNATLNAAVTAGAGSIVYVPAGTYSLTSTVTVSTAGTKITCLGSAGLNSDGSACKFNVSAGTPALIISGANVEVSNIDFVSASTGSGTDDCIKITGKHARVVNVSCEHFGRDGFRVDSSGATNANFAHLEHDIAKSNFGDGFHWAVSGLNNNVTTVINPYSSTNAGYGFHIEAGNDITVISGDAENNTTGDYYLTNTVGDLFLQPYCESATGSTFTLTSSANSNRVYFPLFGQCTTVTEVSYTNNEIKYFDASNLINQNGIQFGPEKGATTPTIYAWQSGQNSNNGWLSLQDVTDNLLLMEFSQPGHLFYFLYPVLGTANSTQYYVPLTGNNAGTHQDSGFMQTGTAAGCTTGSSQGNACASAVSVSFPVNFADTNYKVSCTPRGAPTNYPSTPYTITNSVGSVTVNYIALTAAAASWPNIECTAIHN